MNSYQHSSPGTTSLEVLAMEDNNTISDDWERDLLLRRKQQHRQRILLPLVAIVFWIVTVFAYYPGTSSVALPKQQEQLVNPTMSSSHKYDKGDGEEMPDWNDERGQYDWQKCKDSDDPNCWKEEGERVDNFWSNFGQRMKTFWDRMRGRSGQQEQLVNPTMSSHKYDKGDGEQMPDWNDERGQYDWQKCKDSDDPNCWKEEGERVGNFWSNFGQRMKTFWDRMRERSGQPEQLVNPTMYDKGEQMPDWNDERGRYDWQKCKDSDDPNCWKEEGERVGGFWRNLGHRMKTFWQNFRDRMRRRFGGKTKEDKGYNINNRKENRNRNDDDDNDNGATPTEPEEPEEATVSDGTEPNAAQPATAEEEAPAESEPNDEPPGSNSTSLP